MAINERTPYSEKDPNMNAIVTAAQDRAFKIIFPVKKVGKHRAPKQQLNYDALFARIK